MKLKYALVDLQSVNVLEKIPHRSDGQCLQWMNDNFDGVCVHVHMHMCVCVHLRAFVCMCVHVCACVCMQAILAKQMTTARQRCIRKYLCAQVEIAGFTGYIICN